MDARFEGAPLAGPSRVLDIDAGRVAAAVRGDASAFEVLYRGHVGRIYAVCLRLLADPARAEELTQEAFVRAWQQLGSLRDGVLFAAWLKRIAVNLVVSDGRSRSRWRTADTDFDATPTAPVAADARVDLERAIQLLPTGARKVFVLHDIEGYTHGEIGDLMNISPTTSKTQLHRARRLLRENLI